MKKILSLVLLMCLAFAIFSMVAFAGPAIQDNQMTGAVPQKSFDRIVKEVR